MDSVLIKFEFWALILCSIIAPTVIYVFLMKKPSIARFAVAAFGLFLVLLAGTDVALLKSLMQSAKRTTSRVDDLVFSSEYSLALYLLPVLSASVGCNLISHVLITHVQAAERSHDKHAHGH